MSNSNAHQEMLDDILEEGVTLSSWESDFVKTLLDMRKGGRDWSERQCEKLEEIHDDRVVKGLRPGERA